MNTFDGANLEFQNRGIHFMLGEVIKFRKQLTVRPEFKGQSGWTDALNAYMVEELEKLNLTRSSITYNPDEKSKDDLEAEAADTTATLADSFNARALSIDNTLLPSYKSARVVWDLSGADMDIPQITPLNCPNDVGRAFITGLDELFVMLTRLDSRFQPATITKQESDMVRSHLNMLYTLTQRKGGEAQKSDIPTGTLPSQESLTFGKNA